MNRLIITALVCIAAFSACQKDKSTIDPAPQAPPVSMPNHNAMMRYGGSDYSQAIHPDTANRMIQSYLESIDYPDDNSQLRSLTFDADTLRAYLNDPSIVTLKFMLAHKLEYVHDGKFGVSCENKANAITFVIVGLDENDNYVYNNKNMVYDHTRPCPTDCGNNYSALLY